MEETKFKRGDVVRCKIGGPKMVINGVQQYNPNPNAPGIPMVQYLPMGKITYHCCWWSQEGAAFNNHAPNFALYNFAEDAIELAEEDE